MPTNKEGLTHPREARLRCSCNAISYHGASSTSRIVRAGQSLFRFFPSQQERERKLCIRRRFRGEPTEKRRKIDRDVRTGRTRDEESFRPHLMRPQILLSLSLSPLSRKRPHRSPRKSDHDVHRSPGLFCSRLRPDGNSLDSIMGKAIRSHAFMAED